MNRTPPTAVVTGSSSGIGQAIALELARAGMDVVVHGCQNQKGAQESVDLIRAIGRQSAAVCCDLADKSNWNDFVEECWHQFQPPTVWVNNAGLDVLTGEPAQWSFDRKLESLWQVDVAGTIGVSRLVGGRMRAKQNDPSLLPSIVNIGWDQAFVGMAGDSGEMFAAIKGAIMSFTLSLARSLAPEVRVNCVAPGWIRTKWGEDANIYWQQRACKESLLQRWGTPDDVAKAVRYLVSPDAAFVTGQILRVNGGYKGEYSD